MKKLLFLLMMVLPLISCGSRRTLNTNRSYDDNSLKVQKSAVSQNAFKIIPSSKRISYTISDRKKLKGLTLEQAKEKVLAEAIMYNNCALIVEPNYIYDLKGKKVTKIIVMGFPANYDFRNNK